MQAHCAIRLSPMGFGGAAMGFNTVSKDVNKENADGPSQADTPADPSGGEYHTQKAMYHYPVSYVRTRRVADELRA